MSFFTYSGKLVETFREMEQQCRKINRSRLLLNDNVYQFPGHFCYLKCFKAFLRILPYNCTCQNLHFIRDGGFHPI